VMRTGHRCQEFVDVAHHSHREGTVNQRRRGGTIPANATDSRDRGLGSRCPKLGQEVPHLAPKTAEPEFVCLCGWIDCQGTK
jgi:hypothetical protein